METGEVLGYVYDVRPTVQYLYVEGYGKVFSHQISYLPTNLASMKRYEKGDWLRMTLLSQQPKGNCRWRCKHVIPVDMCPLSDPPVFLKQSSNNCLEATVYAVVAQKRCILYAYAPYIGKIEIGRSAFPEAFFFHKVKRGDVVRARVRLPTGTTSDLCCWNAVEVDVHSNFLPKDVSGLLTGTGEVKIVENADREGMIELDDYDDDRTVRFRESNLNDRYVFYVEL